jgi:glycosyltransferase involved in cell wall biosynthesis
MTLSIIIACANDNFGKDAELYHTIASIRETTDCRPEIVVVDDGSATPVARIADPQVKVVANSRPLGVGPSRHIGALHATGDVLLIVDSHMRFLPGWYEALMHRVEGRPKTLHCATCLAINSGNMDVNHPDAEYHGGALNIYGPDKADARKTQVMEVIWNFAEAEDDGELAAVMGACYVMPRKWFLELAALAHLRCWGCDELMLSLAAWLSGGDIRLMKNVRIAHKFRLAGERSPAEVAPHWPLFNKLLAIRTMLPLDVGARLEKLVLQHGGPGGTKAVSLLEDMAQVVATDRARNIKAWRRDFHWYTAKFNLKTP